MILRSMSISKVGTDLTPEDAAALKIQTLVRRVQAKKRAQQDLHERFGYQKNQETRVNKTGTQGNLPSINGHKEDQTIDAMLKELKDDNIIQEVI